MPLTTESIPAVAQDGTVSASNRDRVKAFFIALVPWVLASATFAWVLAARMQQPGDLYDNDQPKTIAYTVDMIRNHHWAVPRDTLLDPATKPPMYNWLSLPAVLILHSYEPWAFKLPSILATLATCVLIALVAKTISDGQFISAAMDGKTYAGVGALAAAIFLANFSVVKLMYLARPDMLMTAFLTGAWLAGTLALTRSDGSTRVPAAVYWLCVACSALTKGPAALIPIIYVFLAAPLIVGRWNALRRLHWSMAIWLFVGPLALWVILGFVQMGAPFIRVISAQVITRVWEGGPEGIKPVSWRTMPVWYFKNFQPWSVLAVAALLTLPMPRQWSRHPLMPALLWGIVVLAFFSVPGGKRADYLLPIFPPTALLAAFMLLGAGSRFGLTASRAILAVLALVWFHIDYPERRSVTSSDGVQAFAHQITPIVMDDSMVVIGVPRYQPLLPLMGRFDGTVPARADEEKQRLEQLRQQAHAAQWVVLPLNSRWEPRASSGEIGIGNSQRTLQVGLYRVGDPHSPTQAELDAMLPKERSAGKTTTKSDDNDQDEKPAPQEDGL